MPAIVETVTTSTSQATLFNNTQVMSVSGSGVSVVQAGPMSATGTPVTFAMSPYAVASTDMLLLCATSGGAISVVLPTAGAVSGRIVQVADASGSANTNNITVTVSGGGTINGSASSVLNTAYASVTYVSTGGIWIATAGGGGGGGGGGGYATGVRQIVYAVTGVQASGSATIPFDNTTPQITEGWEVLTCSITPQSSTSALIVTAVFNGSNSSSGQPTLAMAIFRDSNANAIGTTLTQAIGQYLNLQVVGQVRVISGSTAATTFRMRVGLNVGTSTVNGQSLAGPIFNNNIATSISIIEVGA